MSLDIIMNTWIVVIGGLLYTIALLGFIYYYMTKQRHLYFVLASDQVIEGDQNVDLKWEWKPEPMYLNYHFPIQTCTNIHT